MSHPNEPGNNPNQPNEFAKIGQWMFVMALILGGLTLFFTKNEQTAYNPNIQPISQLDESGRRSVTLQRNRYGHYVTSGSVNGKPVVFMLDTGATNVAIPGSLENYLGVERGFSFNVHTANGSATAYSTELDQLSIGGITFHNLKAAIAPTMEGDEILLGMSALKELDFEQSGNQLTLYQYRR